MGGSQPHRTGTHSWYCRMFQKDPNLEERKAGSYRGACASFWGTVKSLTVSSLKVSRVKFPRRGWNSLWSWPPVLLSKALRGLQRVGLVPRFPAASAGACPALARGVLPAAFLALSGGSLCLGWLAQTQSGPVRSKFLTADSPELLAFPPASDSLLLFAGSSSRLDCTALSLVSSVRGPVGWPCALPSPPPESCRSPFSLWLRPVPSNAQSL